MIQLETISPTTEIPPEVLDTFAITPERVLLLGGGLVNCSFLVEGPDKKLVVQKLGDDIKPEMIDEIDVYARHLERDGWEAPVPQTTITGTNHFMDVLGNTWRGLKFIESDSSAPSEHDYKTMEHMGILLARWHRTMSWLDYMPKYGIPHFHDTDYHAQKLLENTRTLPSSESVDLASEILSSYRNLPALPKSPAHLLHGDPKLNNMLFRKGKPITFIDFDTVMHGPVWIDIGDMLRSLLAKDISAGRPPDTGKIDSVAAGYFDATRPGIRLAEFTANAILATRQITLELALRYLNDINDDYYFSWDSELHDSRHDNHLVRAGLQWKLFNELEN